LASAGIQAGEIGALRDKATQYAEELGHAQERAMQLQRALDQARSVIAQRDKGLSELCRELKNAADAGNQSQITIAAQKADLMHSVPTGGLDEHAVAAMRTFGDRLDRRENIKVAALGTAGYSLLDVEAAMAKQERDEMRAFEALLKRPTLRRRIVLWLLGSPAEQWRGSAQGQALINWRTQMRSCCPIILEADVPRKDIILAAKASSPHPMPISSRERHDQHDDLVDPASSQRHDNYCLRSAPSIS
jgi:hypothetical protein